MAARLPNVTNFTTPYGASTAKEYGAAAMGAAGNILGGLAPAQASGFTGFSQGLAGLGSAYANNYGAYASGLGNVAQAQANNESNKYGSRAQAEAARQMALGNYGSALIGQAGSIANQALSSWTNNQLGYQKILADMNRDNQQAFSNYGVSRNQALAGLAGAYGDAGGRLGAASAVGDVSATFGDGGFNASGFNASGVSSPVASGSYGVPGGGFYGSLTRTSDGSAVPGIASQTFGGLGRTRDDIMASDLTGEMSRFADESRADREASHYASQWMPSQLRDEGLSGLIGFGREWYGQSGAGMNQFYDSLERAEEADRVGTPDYSTILGGLASGFLHSGDQITGLRGDLGQGYQDFREDIGSMFDYDPVEAVRKQREVRMLSEQWKQEDALRRAAATRALSRERYWDTPAFRPVPVNARGGFDPTAMAMFS